MTNFWEVTGITIYDFKCPNTQTCYHHVHHDPRRHPHDLDPSLEPRRRVHDHRTRRRTIATAVPPNPAHSWIFAKISASLKRWYSYIRPETTKQSSRQNTQTTRNTRLRNSTTYLLADLDRVPSPSGQQHAVARPHRRRYDLALLVWRTRTHGDDRRLGQRAARRGRGKEDACCGFLCAPATSSSSRTRETMTATKRCMLESVDAR